MDQVQRQKYVAGHSPELAARLFRELPQGFFGVLSSRNASIYLDTLDALESVLSSGGSLTRSEAVACGTLLNPETFTDKALGESESRQPTPPQRWSRR